MPELPNEAVGRMERQATPDIPATAVEPLWSRRSTPPVPDLDSTPSNSKSPELKSGPKPTPLQRSLSRRSMSFNSFGNLEQLVVHSARSSDGSGTSGGRLDVVEPATPQRRSITTDHLQERACKTSNDLGYGFDFDALPQIEEAGEADSRRSLFATPAPAASHEDDDQFFNFDALPSPPAARSRSPAGGRRPPADAPAKGASLASLPAGASTTSAPAAAAGGLATVAKPAEPAPATTTAAPAPAARPPAAKPALPLAAPAAKPARNAGRRRTSAPPTPRSDGLRVALISNGSRGDLMPLLALGRSLIDHHRHKACVFTNMNLLGLSVEHGIDAVPVFADTQAVFEMLGGISGTAEEAVRKGFTACVAWLRKNPGACVAAEDALEEYRPQAIVYGGGSSGPAMRYSQKAAVPAMPVWLQREVLELFEDQLYVEPPRPMFFAVSRVLDGEALPKAPRFHRTGNWTREEQPAPEDLADGGPLAELRRFLEAGPPPVAVGWGSMIVEGLPPARMLALALRTLRAAGRRGVVIGGWSRLDELGRALGAGEGPDGPELAAFAAQEVCFVATAPHAWLFPRCSCAVHHGGAGTTHAALRVGLPSVVTPVFADQFMVAQAVQRAGAGFGFELSLPEITQEDLLLALRAAEACRPAAGKLAEKLQHEQGVKHASAIIDSFLRREVQGGQWARKAGMLKSSSNQRPVMRVP